MPQFKIEGDELRREARSRMISWGAVLLLLLATVVLIAPHVSGDIGGGSDLGLLAVSTFLGAFIGAIVLAFREAFLLAERQMVFVLDNNEIIRKRRGYPDVRIAFSEVASLSEELGRLIIKGREPGKKIAVPENVNGYGIIRSELAKHYPLSPRPKVSSKSTGLTTACILSWAAVMWFHDVRIVVPAAAAGLIFLGFGSRRMWTSLRGRSPRLLLWVSLGFAWIVAILLVYLRVMQSYAGSRRLVQRPPSWGSAIDLVGEPFGLPSAMCCNENLLLS